MLREVPRLRNHSARIKRRSFTDSDMDLYVWFSAEVPVRFHLTYNKQGTSASLSWNNESGFERPRFRWISTPVLMTGLSDVLDPLFMDPNRDTPASVLAYRFLQASDNIAPWLADFIYARLLEYPGHNAGYIDQGTVLRSF